MKMSSNTSERRKELGNKLDMITPRHLSATGSMSNALWGEKCSPGAFITSP